MFTNTKIPLLKIANLAFSKATKDWEMALTLLIYKKADRRIYKNYRGISTSVVHNTKFVRTYSRRKKNNSDVSTPKSKSDYRLQHTRPYVRN